MPLFMVPDMMPLIMKFKYEDFLKKDITRFMQWIWPYSDAHGKKCKVCRTYRLWAISAMKKKKWLSCSMDFETVVTKLIKRDQHWCNIPNIAPQESLFLNAPIHQPRRPLPPI